MIFIHKWRFYTITGQGDTAHSFPLRIFSVNVIKSAENLDLDIFTEEILNGKLQFLCSVKFKSKIIIPC